MVIWCVRGGWAVTNAGTSTSAPSGSSERKRMGFSVVGTRTGYRQRRDAASAKREPACRLAFAGSLRRQHPANARRERTLLGRGHLQDMSAVELRPDAAAWAGADGQRAVVGRDRQAVERTERQPLAVQHLAIGDIPH